MSCGFIDPFRHSNSLTSCNFDGSAETLYRAGPNTPSDSHLFTLSAWIKTPSTTSQYICASGRAGNNFGGIGIADSGTLFWIETNNGAPNFQTFANIFSLNDNAWHHVVLAADTTQADVADRVKFYADGVNVGKFSSSGAAIQDYQPWLTTNRSTPWTQGVGARAGSTSSWSASFAAHFDGHLTEVAFVDGQQLTPSSFASKNAPKDLSALNFGTNGFWLRFKTGTGMGSDSTGIGDFTLVNISAADQSDSHP